MEIKEYKKMIDLILVDPPINNEKRFGKLAKAGSFLPSLGLASLAAVAREAGFSVKIIDANMENLDLKQLVLVIMEEKPKWVGISATTLTIESVGKLSGYLKKVNPHIVVMVGGAHVTALPKVTLQSFPGIDIGVIGEGEETFKELLLVLDKNQNLEKVDGLVYRQNKKVIFTKPRKPIVNLDKLPMPAWGLISGFPQKYTPSVNSYLHLPAAHLMTSRGCTGCCIFCDRSVFGRVPRMYSSKKVMEMIDFLIANYGIKEIQFFDDNFCLFPQRLEEICKYLMKKNPKISWSCQARADMVQPRLLSLMKKAGCFQIGLGIESGSNIILKILKKQETSELISEKIKEINKAGLEVKGYFILGNPGETKKTLKETEEFIKVNPLSYVHTTFFTPYPGSEIFKKARRYGKFLCRTNEWFKIGMGTIDPVYLVKGITKKDLNEEARKIFKLFYFQPKVIIDRIKKVATTPILWSAYFKGLFSVLAFIKK